MNDFQRMAATTALKDMFENSNHFNVCVVDKLLKLTGCIPDKKDYQALSLLHCVSWVDMEPELRQMVQLKTMQMFDTPGFNLEAIENVFKKGHLRLNG